MALTFGKVLTKVFGSRNDRLLKRYRRAVEQINALEPEVRKLTDPQMRERTQELRKQIQSGQVRPSAALPEAFALIRESMDRNIGIRTIFDPAIPFDTKQLSPELLAMYDQVQKTLMETGQPWQSVPIPPALYDGIRALYPESRPPYRTRCFDVQIIGGLVLYEGKIAEMATGEGKTFVAPLACFVRVLEGHHCHVVTVNDYLVRRDSTWIKPAFENLGFKVGYIQSDMEPGGDIRRSAYQCDVTYGTNSEFGFDFLRDNMKERASLQVQGPLQFAVVDEVDSILIDEARTPLIISGAAHDDAAKYRNADEVARKVIALHKPYGAVEAAVDAAQRAIKTAEGDQSKAKNSAEKDAARKRQAEAEQQLQEAEAKKQNLTQYYEVEWDRKSAHLTHEGIAAAQDAAGVGSFFVGDNMEWPHLMEQAMRAHVVYERDKDYVVERGAKGQMEVIIVDEFTGRKMVGRQWSDGLHQAVEAKERVPIKEETQTLATVTLQNYFRMYKFLSGMTGTAQTEAEEFGKIYRLDVVTIPTNRPIKRADYEDRVYRTEREKWESILEEIKRASDAGRPVLVGTTSVEKSEALSNMLTRKYGVQHEVLNAKQHERESNIVALAGQQHKNSYGEIVGNVTIATNMAGRGTDIKLANETLWDVTAIEADPEKRGEHVYSLTQRGTGVVTKLHSTDEKAEAFELKADTKLVGGLHVIGTERHTARRIDNQLRGRSGRQGDPGSSRFYVSFQDELLKNFAGEWTIKIMGWLGMEEGMSIEDKRITKGILRAQKKVEERNYLARKNLLEYDEVMDQQRTGFYGMRQRVLIGDGIEQVIWDMIGQAIQDAVDKYITQDFIAATVSEWVRVNFSTFIEPNDLSGKRTIAELEEYVKTQARAEAETNITATLGEFMGEEDDEESEGSAPKWDTKGLQSWAMSRFQVNLSQSQVVKMSPPEVEEKLRLAAVEQIDKRNCDGLLKFLEPLYAEQELAAWARAKFSIEITPQEFMADVASKTPHMAPEIVELIETRARAAYARREIEYPVEHVLTYAYGGPQGFTDNPFAAQFIHDWALAKFRYDLDAQQIRFGGLEKLRDTLVQQQESFMGNGAIERYVDGVLQANPDTDSIIKTVNERFGWNLAAKDFQIEADDQDAEGPVVLKAASPEQVREMLSHRVREFFRRELTDLEQFVLIHIFDQSWKDHLYAMDLLKASIGLMAFAEQDPRVQYKKEGFRFFEEMMSGIRDKVTDLIFRARVTAQTKTRSAYRETSATHETTSSYGVAENREAAATTVAAANNSDMQAAANRTQGEALKVKQIKREAVKVGRNDPCPCGSGKKYKKCCGASA